MRIEQFTEADIKDAAQLAYPIWGVGHGESDRGGYRKFYNAARR